MFDEPVEHATEWIFHTAFKAIGGPDAVREKPKAAGHGAPKEKEL